MRKGLEFILALAVLAGLVFAGREVSRYASAQKVEANKLVVLDPGHGGRDPGKVGVGDVLEKRSESCHSKEGEENTGEGWTGSHYDKRERRDALFERCF